MFQSLLNKGEIMRIRVLLGYVAVIAALAFPSMSHAAVSSGIFGNIDWTSEIQLNKRTSVFGQYGFGYGRTRAQPRSGATLLSSSVTVQLFKNGVVATTKSGSAIPNPLDSYAATATATTSDVAVPGQFQTRTKHSFSAVGVTSSIPDMSTPVSSF